MWRKFKVWWDKWNDKNKFYTLYPDGSRSSLLCYRYAVDLGVLFGGEVYHVDYKNEIL